MAGQLWQRVLRKPAWHCVAITLMLWALAACWLAADSVAPRAHFNFSELNLSDGVNKAEEYSVLMGGCFVPFYFLLIGVIRIVHERFRRDEPERYRHMLGHMGLEPPEIPCILHYVGCCTLAGRMVATFVQPHRYSPWTLLPQQPPARPREAADVELGEGARARGTRAVAPAPEGAGTIV